MPELHVGEGDVPFTVTASLLQGVVVDPHLGLSLDGGLASVVRRLSGPPGLPGSLLDGGLAEAEPTFWSLPLAQCSGDGGDGWHWAVSGATLLDGDGQVVDVAGVPDVHRLSTAPDERRAPWTAVRLPADLGGRRGRFRPRLRPVLAIPARQAVWRAVGCPETTQRLLGALRAVGARRGAGEGQVVEWRVEAAAPEDIFRWLHLADGRPSRPMPVECAQAVQAEFGEQRGGLRPPLFHPSTQRLLAVP